MTVLLEYIDQTFASYIPIILKIMLAWSAQAYQPIQFIWKSVMYIIFIIYTT